MIVTIDGPAGTGKSTIARKLAQELGFRFLDTGAMYRAIAWFCLDQQVDLARPHAIAEAAFRVEMAIEERGVHVNGINVTDFLRLPDVTQAASLVAAVPAVRQRLVQLQRQFGKHVNLVTEGRDQGTIVFPQAERKFFLTATADERARRRQRELQNQGVFVEFGEILAQQFERDARDLNRECAPLRKADDAIEIDTSDLTVEDVVKTLVQLVASAR